MPEIHPLPAPVEVDLEERPFDLEQELLSQNAALNLVTKTFYSYETQRDGDHLGRWANHESLYYGAVRQRFWPGSKIRRSSLGVPIVFEQEEALLPALESSLFTQFPYWFTAEAIPGFSSVQEAQDLQARMCYWFETPRDADGRIVVDQIALALQQIVHHGNGVVQIGWDDRGYFCEWVDLRDLYVSPKLKTPWIDDSPAIIHRPEYTIAELKGMGLKLPPDPVLNFLAKNKTSAGGDQSRALAEAYRGLQFGADAMEPDPAKQTIECLVYWTNNRLNWILGRGWVAHNGANEYGFKPFCGSPFIPALQSWYSAALGDFLEGEQRLTQGLLNSRLDEIHLGLDPARVRKKSAYAHPGALRMRPGLVDQVDRPKEDVVFQMPGGITNNSYVEVQLSEQRAQRRTGISEMSMGGGMARPAQTRTAAGVAALGAGSSNRLYMHVKRVERYLLTSLLYKTARLIGVRDGGNQVGLFIDEQGQQQAQEIQGPLNKRVRFKLGAATRALSQDKQRAMLPIILQTYLSGPMIQSLAALGKVPDVEQIDKFVQDATGSAQIYKFVRDMNEQEKQAAQAPPPQVQAKMQADQMAAQTRMQIMQMKVEGNANTQAEKSAIELLKIFAEEKGLSEELRIAALKIAADLSKPAAGGKSGGTSK